MPTYSHFLSNTKLCFTSAEKTSYNVGALMNRKNLIKWGLCEYKLSHQSKLNQILLNRVFNLLSYVSLRNSLGISSTNITG